MQVTELSSKGLKKNYKIVVEKARIASQMEVELKAAGEQVKIPGFRPGYIPMKILKQRYGQAVQGDVLKQVINQVTNEFINEKKYRPALTPQINIEAYKDGEDLAFTIAFEEFPQMPEVDFAKITLNRKVYEIADKDIDAMFENIAKGNHKKVRAEKGAKAALGNIVIIDFKGSVGGVPFAGGTADNFELELGSKQFIDGFEAQLVGAKEGDERTVTVTFPKTYHAKELAGKEADFAVTVHEIHDKEPAEIDDAFAKSKGFTDLETFRKSIRGQMAKEYDGVVRNHLKKELFDILEEECNMELPQGMVDIEFNSIWERLQEAKKQGDESLASKTDDELTVEYKSVANRRVKLGLLLADIGSKHKLEITREELTRAIMQQASMFPGEENKVVEFYRKNPERMKDLQGPILEEKAVDYILSKVKMVDEPISLEELLEDDGEDDGGIKSKSESKPAKKTAKKSDEDAKTEDSSKKTMGKKKAPK